MVLDSIEYENLFTKSAKEIAADIMSVGYSMLSFGSLGRSVCDNLRKEGETYFNLPDREKLTNASEDFNYGYRAQGRQYSIVPSRPDLNESFVFRGGKKELVPNSRKIPFFLDKFKSYQSVMDVLCSETFHALSDTYKGEYDLDFVRSSYVEFNWYRSSGTRDLLQDRHEDGHLLTVVNADKPGLEVETSSGMMAVDFDGVDLVVMSGSLLTVMTGGDIPPTYHQVRNHFLSKRSSILYLLNPPFDEVVPPFPGKDNGLNSDVSKIGRSKGAMFGLNDSPES